MPEAKVVNLAMAGYGTVGRAFHRILHDQGPRIKERLGYDLRLIAAARRDRFVVNPDGLDIKAKRDWQQGNIFEMLGTLDGEGGNVAHVFLEASPTDLTTAQPALGHVRGALREGLPVVLANKGPLVVAYDEVMDRAAEAGLPVLFEATVAGCIPTLNTVRHAFAADPIHRIEGILNGTTNFILSRMHTEGSDLQQALREAQQLGYAEADPTADVEGLDAAAKVVILSNAVLGRSIGMDDVDIEGISNVSRQAIELAGAHGYRVKLIAEADAANEVARVSPRLVPAGSPLDVQGALNAVRFHTDLAGAVTHIGKGAGGQETAAAMLGDVIDAIRQQG